MANKQIKIKLEIQYVNGNTKKKTPVIPLNFKTVDHAGSHVFFNRGRGIDELLDFLFDHKLTRPAEVIIKSLNYDREARLQEGKIVGNNIQIGEDVIFTE